MNKITEEFVKEKIGKRCLNTHKGDYGKILVIAGAGEMPGAAFFTAKSALRTGSGLVYVCTGRENFAVLQTLVPEAICLDCEKIYAGQSDGSSEAGMDINSYDAVAFGPGMGTSDTASNLLQQILSEGKVPLIMDADGLNIISDRRLSDKVKKYKAEVVITPHIGEAKRLFEDDMIEDYSRKLIALKLQKKYGCNVVLKGNRTLVCAGQEWDDTWTNTTGNPGMATGGAGDVLTGIIAALAAQGYEPFEASKIGVYVHGLAGDICEAKIGQIGMTAIDILDKVPKAFKTIQEKNG
mgnify:CR=1 FL=1